jgi:fructose-bisphosphate aldolase class I
MDMTALSQIAKQLVAPGKGIIAADESSATCQKRYDTVGVPCTEETRRAYRETLLAAPGIEEYVSGVILYDETIRQKVADGTPFPQMLAAKGVLPGIKVDAGAKDLALHPGEKITEGLDGLRERIAGYVALGAKFAKWRAVITIGPDIPSQACMHGNAHALARYAALCQEGGLVPIVEPEVLIDGDHSIERCFEVASATLRDTFKELDSQNVAPQGLILKASMVIAGKKSSTRSSAQQVADMTLKCLKENVPQDLAGVVFLSGGQSDEQATENLDAMNKIDGAPWPLTFSYSRAIQNPVLKIWAQDRANNVRKARDALLFRCKMNSLASKGVYTKELEAERPYQLHELVDQPAQN